MASSKKADKKVVAPKPKAVSITKPTKKVLKKALGVPFHVSFETENKPKLVTFTVRATIPTQTFGNIQPEIVCTAASMEDAKVFVLPVIEEIYAKYCETPRDGSSKPSFLPKSEVTVTERNVGQTQAGRGAMQFPAVPPFEDKLVGKVQKEMTIKEKNDETIAALDAAPVAKTPVFEKAEKAIAASLSRESLDIIEDQVHKSEKLSVEDKPILLTLVLKKRKEFQ